MRFIDEKGRLFGAVNVFDLFVICALLVAAVFAFRWARVSDDPSWVKIKLLKVRFIGVMQVPSYVAPLIKEGDETVDGNNVVMARIEKILSDEPFPAVTYQSNAGDKIFFNNDARNIIVQAEVSAYEKKGDIYSCMTNEPMKVGISVTMIAKNYSAMIQVRKILE